MIRCARCLEWLPAKLAKWDAYTEEHTCTGCYGAERPEDAMWREIAKALEVNA